MNTAAALIVIALLVVLTAFQLALIAGAPLGHFAWGGQDRVLPSSKRIGSAFSIVIYAIFAVIIAQRAGLIDVLPVPAIADIGIWVIVAYSVLGIGMNAISRSKPERYTMTPLCVALAALTLVVALS